MQRLVTALALVGTLLPVALQAQAPSTPGLEHKKLEIWVGDWTYEADVKATPLGPASKVNGKVTVRPALGGFFVEWNGEDKGPTGPIGWHEIDGYDPATKKYMWFTFGSDGGFQTVTYTIDGTKVPYAGTQVIGANRYQIKGTIVFAADFMSNVEKREISLDGQTWMPFFEFKGTKTKWSGQ